MDTVYRALDTRPNRQYRIPRPGADRALLLPHPIDSIAKPLPADYRRPVIYVLDGNSLFPLVAHVGKAIGLFSSQVPGSSPYRLVTLAMPHSATPKM